MGVLGNATDDIYLSCERCGASGAYETDHLAAMNLQWSAVEKERISDQYWEHKFVRCPNDYAVLHIQDIGTFGSAQGQFHARCPHCGRQFQSGELIDPESFEAKYTVLRSLGKGGMGQVDLVRRNSDGKEFAAKHVLPQFLNNAEMVQRFQRETRICQKLDHSHVVRLHDHFLDQRGGILVMELLSGGTLRSLINDRSTSVQCLARCFVEVVAGLSYIHGLGIVHRDLKPGNVLISGDGRACVSDLGLARLLERDTTALTSTGAFLGTRHYAAPEQINQARDVTTMADIYALGLIAYEIATRCSPNYRLNFTDFRPSLAAAIQACLALEPADRPSSGNMLAGELSAAFT